MCSTPASAPQLDADPAGSYDAAPDIADQPLDAEPESVRVELKAITKARTA